MKMVWSPPGVDVCFLALDVRHDAVQHGDPVLVSRDS